MEIINKLTTLLNNKKIDYWVDQGTLLSIIRDGKLKNNYDYHGEFFHLDDIDIGIFETQVEKINLIKSEILGWGYKLRVCYYEQRVFQLKFLPNDSSKNNIIDIKVYYDSNKSYYWSVKKVPRLPNNIFTNKLNRIILSKWYWEAEKASIDKIPLSIILKPYTWYLPKKIINPIVYDTKTKFFIPSKVDSYLSHHFGNWNIKKDNWKSYRDDRAL